jgi:hypothetical protein
MRSVEDQFAFVANKIKSAQRFVIGPDIRSTVQCVLTAKPSSILSALPFARLPYPTCWFEWTPPDVHDKERLGMAPGQIAVRRVGALLQEEAPGAFSMFTAWKFSEAAARDALVSERVENAGRFNAILRFGVSAIQAGFDFSDMDKPAMDFAKGQEWFQKKTVSSSPHALAELQTDERNGIRHAMRDERERLALEKIEKRAAFRIMTEINGQELLGLAGKYGGRDHLHSAMADVTDEMGHILATLILMNSKNCIEFKNVEPPPKLNKARRKQGKLELLPYSTVEIKLNKPAARAADEGRGDEGRMRRHLVRGHFKVRATGIFWWHHFMRGDEQTGTVEHKKYKVG